MKQQPFFSDHCSHEPVCLDALSHHEHEIPVLLFCSTDNILVRSTNPVDELGLPSPGILYSKLMAFYQAFEFIDAN